MLLLSGNEAIALGAYHAGVKVATAYPGTPSTEILETLAGFKNIYAEWSTNEKVAMEVALGAACAGVRSIVAMKHVGLNVASDPFMAAAITGVNAGMVVVTADDPGIHSSQNEQDNRNYARLAKVPMLEPADSQEAYELLAYAFNISEKFDTPVILRSTTRISHSKSVVNVKGKRKIQLGEPRFDYNLCKYVMLPANARLSRFRVEQRLLDVAEYSESIPLNRVIEGSSNIGIVSSGIAYQYAREVFPEASFLKLTMTYPLPRKMIHRFAAQVDKLLVIEELEPFMQEYIQAMGIKVIGKEYIPTVGELNPEIIAAAGRGAGLLPEKEGKKLKLKTQKIPNRPPLLCPGCPHSGVFYVLSSLGQRSILPGKKKRQPKFVITGD
ncbi:MAG: indolepyruvate ferredoxin oxidoreductase subunit alpha, partial [Dehalococcoidia bacterium]